jgi:hypothetical protein
MNEYELIESVTFCATHLKQVLNMDKGEGVQDSALVDDIQFCPDCRIRVYIRLRAEDNPVERSS